MLTCVSWRSEYCLVRRRRRSSWGIVRSRRMFLARLPSALSSCLGNSSENVLLQVSRKTLTRETESTCGSAVKQKNISKNHYSVYWLPLGAQEKWRFYRVISKKVRQSQAVLLSWYNPREVLFQCRFLRFPVGRGRKEPEVPPDLIFWFYSISPHS